MHAQRTWGLYVTCITKPREIKERDACLRRRGAKFSRKSFGGEQRGEATRDENYPFESAKACGWALPTRDSSRKSLERWWCSRESHRLRVGRCPSLLFRWHCVVRVRGRTKDNCLWSFSPRIILVYTSYTYLFMILPFHPRRRKLEFCASASSS